MIDYTDTITVEDYNRLRESVGWQPLVPEQAEAGLRGTAFLVAAMEGGRAVGLIRLVCDGGYVAYLSDVIVLPEYQGRGIGKEMMERAMGYLRGQLKPGWRVQASLIAAQGKEPFYEKFGFDARPSERTGAGMAQWLEGESLCLPA
jgi:GNAT superfamily N-acetyltransferase